MKKLSKLSILSFFLSVPVYAQVTHSVLSQGTWYRVGVTSAGIYSLSGSFLQGNGVNISGINPNTIKVHGFGGGPLPERIGTAHPDDLPELKVKVLDGGTPGVMDASDAILFYAQGPHPVVYNATERMFNSGLNPYADTAYYFIRLSGAGNNQAPPQRASEAGTPALTLNKYTDYALIEKDSLNIANTGRRWFWKSFEFVNSYSVSHSFSGGGYVDSVRIKVDMAGRCVNCLSSQTVMLNGSVLGSIGITTNSGLYDGPMGDNSTGIFTTSPKNSFSFVFNKPASVANVWLDKININAARELARYGSFTLFRNPRSLEAGIIRYTVGNASSSLIWDVTDPLQPLEQQHSGGTFAVNGGTLYEFAVFDPSAAQPQPVWFGPVQNQDLHGMPYVDMIIVAPEFLWPEAQRLATHRFQRDGISSGIVSPRMIYNEFSSGMQDPTALRNFMKMFRDRTTGGQEPMVRYLLLFGDASYDYKDHLLRTTELDENKNPVNKNTNLVPTWETKNSYNRSGGSYASDDYFVMLDPNNIVGLSEETEVLNVAAILSSGVGRLLAYDLNSARDVVDKIIHYDDNAECFRDWRNKILLLADDMDQSWESLFVDGSEHIAAIMQSQFPEYNVDKIYADSYTQTVGAGQRYPEAEKQLFTSISNGVLLLNYIGHGGEVGLSSERLLAMEDIDKWDNFNRLPVFLTATCTFTRFDQPAFISAGEKMAMRKDGGAIALISTTRAISLVGQFNDAFYNAAFTPGSDGSMPALGDVFRLAKSNSSDGTSGPISLFGDPSQKMAYPRNKVYTTGVYDENDNPIDTIKATQVVKVKGYVADTDGFLMPDFDGTVYPTIFDKAGSYQTKLNDAPAVLRNFKIQKNVLFKGAAPVENGRFEFIFKVPKDINYMVGNGKISYYASNSATDAHGYDTVKVGSSLNNCNEQDAPSIGILLNDSPVNGLVVGVNPEIRAVFSDESGINSSGIGIGHDIVATLRGPQNQTFILNDYYSSFQGTYKKGELRYPLLNLPEGDYTLQVSAWDNCNNYGESSIAFRVDSTTALISEFLPYPNPSSDQVTFAFTHNLPEGILLGFLHIYDVNGRLVHSINRKIASTSYRNTEFVWDGRNSAGGKLAPGIYFCRMRLVGLSGKEAYATAKIIRTN